MGRFSGNPPKGVLAGNECIPATDLSTGSDIVITPFVLAQFVMTYGQVANGSSNGLIDAANYAKLKALDTQAQTDTRVAKLAEVAIPIFFGGVLVDGSFSIYTHVLDIPWVLSFQQLLVSAGSTNVTLTKNGVAIAGLTTNPATTVTAQYPVSGGSSGYTFNQGDVLGITFAGTTGNAKNLAASVKANATIPP